MAVVELVTVEAPGDRGGGMPLSGSFRYLGAR